MGRDRVLIEEKSDLIQQRIKKLNRLRELGIDPYGGPFDVKDSAREIFNEFGEKSKDELESLNHRVTIAGRIISLRDFGKTIFAHIQDSSGRIQIYLSKDIISENKDLIKNLDIGDIIGISGILFRTKTNELTINVDSLTLLCKSLRPLPEKWHGLRDIETRCRQRYVDLIVNPHVKEHFIKRSRFIKLIRDFFDSRGFIEVETPMMHPIPGGASARPFITHHNALDIDLYLRIAPELYLKRLLVGGFERVYEINKNFRNEGISSKHNPEFTMLEFYIAYKDYNYLMDLTEELVTHLCREICEGLTVPFSPDPEAGKETTIDFTPPWPRISMMEAMERHGVDRVVFEDINRARNYAQENYIDIKEESTHAKILDEIFKKKVEPKLIQPIFITDYPVDLSPLAKRKRDNPSLVERFELFIGAREIANAFSELNDPADQRTRFEEQVEARERGDEEGGYMDEDFIRALEYGMPPAAGEGIGIDRLFMILTNTHSIRDVILFPLLRPEH